MSNIIVKCLSEELAAIAEEGMLIIYSDMTLGIKKSDGSVVPVKAELYYKILDLLEKNFKMSTSKLVTSNVFTPTYAAETLKNADVVVFESDTDVLDYVGSDLEKQSALIIQYQNNDTPTVILPETEVGSVWYLNDPENDNKKSTLQYVINNLRDRLILLDDTVSACVTTVVFNSTMANYLAKGTGFDNDKYPDVKHITDAMEANKVTFDGYYANLLANYLPAGGINRDVYPNVATIVQKITNLGNSITETKTDLTNNYLVKGAGYPDATYPNILSITSLLNSIITDVQTTIANLSKKVDKGAGFDDAGTYNTAQAMVEAISTLYNSLNALSVEVTGLINTAKTYLSKGDGFDSTKYPNINKIVELVVNNNTLADSKLPKGNNLPTEYDSAVKMYNALSNITTNVNTANTNVSGKLSKGSSTYNDAGAMEAFINQKISEYNISKAEYDDFIVNVLPNYLAKGGVLPYGSFFAMYLDLTSVMAKIDRIQTVFETKKAELLVSRHTELTADYFANVVRNFAYSTESYYTGGQGSGTTTSTYTLALGNNSHGIEVTPDRYQNILVDDTANGNRSPAIISYTPTPGSLVGARLYYITWAEGKICGIGNEYKDFIHSVASLTGTPYGGSYDSSSSPAMDSEEIMSFRTGGGDGYLIGGSAVWEGHSMGIHDNIGFCAGGRGANNTAYFLHLTGPIVKVDMVAHTCVYFDAVVDAATVTALGASADTQFGIYPVHRQWLTDTGLCGGNLLVVACARKNNTDPVALPSVANYLYVNDYANNNVVRHADFPFDVTFMTPLGPNTLYVRSSVTNSSYIMYINPDTLSYRLKSVPYQTLFVRMFDSDYILYINTNKEICLYDVNYIETFAQNDNSLSLRRLKNMSACLQGETLIAFEKAAVALNTKGPIVPSGTLVPTNWDYAAMRNHTSIFYDKNRYGLWTLCIGAIRLFPTLGAVNQPSNVILVEE